MKILVPIILAAIIFPIIIWVIVMMRKESKKIITKTFSEVELEGIKKLKCPKCDKYMDIGYAIASKGIIFRKKEEAFKFIAPDRFLSNTANMSFGVRENIAWKCNECKLVLIDYSCQVKKNNKN